MDIVLLGTAPRGRALRRSTSKIGDRIYVTGYLGGAAAELEQLVKSPRRFRNATTATEDAGLSNSHPHLFPEPRLAVGGWLLKNHRAAPRLTLATVCRRTSIICVKNLVWRLLSMHPRFLYIRSCSVLQDWIVTRHCSLRCMAARITNCCLRRHRRCRFRARLRASLSLASEKCALTSLGLRASSL